MNVCNVQENKFCVLIILLHLIATSFGLELNIVYIGIYTKSIDSVFCVLWLDPQTQDSMCYSPPSIVLDLACEFLSQKNRNYYFGAGYPLVWYNQCTKTIIHLSVSEEWWIFTSPLRGSANIHHYSPSLRWIIVNYLMPRSKSEWRTCASREFDGN